MKSEDEVRQLSAEAGMIWNSPLVKDFMENFVKKVFIEWTNEQDPVQRELLWLKVQAADAFKGMFLSYLAGGRALEKKKGIGDTIGPII